MAKDYWWFGFLEIQALESSLVLAKRPACESNSVHEELRNLRQGFSH